MKKIVFVTGRLGGGGSERVLTTVANALNEKEYDVTIVAFSKTGENYKVTCNIYDLEAASQKNNLGTFDQVKGLRKAFLSTKPDVIIAFEYHVGMKSILAATGLKTRIIVSERNDPHQLEEKKLKCLLRDKLFAMADDLVCQTEDAAEYFYNRIQKRGTVIPNPITANLPRWQGNDRKVILNFCRLEKQKNLELLISAFERFHKTHNDYTLVIYGEGKERKNLETLVKQKKLDGSVVLHPFSKDIHNIAANSLMFVSSSDYEGISNSMIEALAIGMPVVCTDCPIGGARMAIQSGQNGILVPVGDVQALSDAMCLVSDNEELRRSIADKAYEIREAYSVERVVDMWETLL